MPSSVTSTSRCSGIRLAGPEIFEFVRDDVHHGTRVANAIGDADGYDRKPGFDRFIGRDALEIGMNHASRDGVTLDLAHERGLSFTSALGERDDRVTPGAMNKLLEGVGVNRDMLGYDAMPVEHRWDLSGRAQCLGSGCAEFLSSLDGELEVFCSHGFLYKRRR